MQARIWEEQALVMVESERERALVSKEVEEVLVLAERIAALAQEPEPGADEDRCESTDHLAGLGGS